MSSRIVGINLGVTSEHVTCISNGDEKPSKKTIRFSYLSQDELDKLCAQTKRESGTQLVHFIREATGMSWFLLALHAKKMGHSISKVKAQSMSTLRRFSRRHCKSDYLNARTLARTSLIDAQSLQEIQLTDATTFALKRASR